MQRKKLLVTVFILSALLAVLLFFLLKPRVDTLVVGKPLLPSQYGDIFVTENEHVRFFNGRMFVEYDPKTGESKALISEASFPGIEKVRWSKDGNLVALQSAFNSSADIFGQELRKRGLTLNHEYWWLFNISANSFVPLPVTTTDVSWNENSLTAWISERGGDSNMDTFYNVGEVGQLSKIGESSGAVHKLLRATPKGIYYLVRESESYSVRLLRSDGKETTLRQNLNNDVALASPDGNYVLVTEIKDGRSNNPDEEAAYSAPATFHIFVPGSGDDYASIDGFSDGAIFAFSSDSSQLLIAETKLSSVELLQYDLQNNITTRRAAGSKKGQPPVATPINLFSGSHGLILIQEVGSYRPVQDNNETFANPRLILDESVVQEDGFILNQRSSRVNTNQIIVTIFSHDVAGARAKAIEEIKSQGINPELLDIIYEAN